MSIFKTINPKNYEIINEYSHWNSSQISHSLTKSEDAFQKWRRVSLNERCELLGQLKRALEGQKSQLAAKAAEEMGKTTTEAVAEIEKCAKLLSYYQDHAPEFLRHKTIATEHQHSFVSYQPLGSILCIMPWNFPYWQVFRAAIPAICAGNAILLKHAENTTGTALEIEKLMLSSGLPKNLFQTLLVDHDQTAEIIKSRTVAAVSLTGSERAGRTVAATAGGALKKCVLELGGSDPYIIFADANVKNAAELCMRSRLINNGQSCIAAKRFIVHRDIFDSFKEECVAIASKKVIGDPTLKETHIGPLAKESILLETKKQLKESVERGAKVVFQSSSIPETGFYQPIVILDQVAKGQPVFDEEVFAPVASLIKFTTTEEAVHLANDHRYALGAAVFTNDLTSATELALNRIDGGFVAVNSMVISDPRLPFGGVKDSGYGRELSIEGMIEFVNTKTIVVNS